MSSLATKEPLTPRWQTRPTNPTKGWRTARRTRTLSLECPKCGRRQHPADNCCNPKCKADIHGRKNPLAGLLFNDLRHCAATKSAEWQDSDQTIMSIAGYVSRAMLELFSHIRLAAKHAALDSISIPLPDPSTLRKQVNFPTSVHQDGTQNGLRQNEAVAKWLN